MSTPATQYPLPTNLAHRPVVATPYFDHDPGREGDTDAHHLSLGWSQWNSRELSLKVFRYSGGKWSRQSEELPLARAVDLVILLVAVLRAPPGATSVILPAGTLEGQADDLRLPFAGNVTNPEFAFFLEQLRGPVLMRRLSVLADMMKGMQF